MVTSNGKFHGTIAPTTPTGSCHTLRVVFTPVTDTTVSPRSVSHGKSSISLAGYLSPSSSGASSCGPWVTARGHPTSRMSSSRSSSCSAFDRVVQLQQTPLAQFVIGRPVRLVERAPRRVDGAVHVGLRRVGDLAEHVLVGRVDVGERARLAVDELAVDHHLATRTSTSVPQSLLSLSPAGFAGESRIASDANRAMTGCGSTLAANTIARCASSAGKPRRASIPAWECPSPVATCGAFPQAGSNLLDDQQHRRVRPDAVATEGAAIGQRLHQPVGEPSPVTGRYFIANRPRLFIVWCSRA